MIIIYIVMKLMYFKYYLIMKGKNIVKSKPEQFCKIIQECMEHYSKDTTALVGSLLNSHERVFQIEEILKKQPTEQELMKILSEKYPEDYQKIKSQT